MPQRRAEAAAEENQEVVHQVFPASNHRQDGFAPCGRSSQGSQDRPARRRAAAGGCRPHSDPPSKERSGHYAEHFVDMVPVHEVFEKRLQIIRTAVAIVDVIGVLPDVAAEDRAGAMHQRVLAIGGLGDLELAALDLQPAPAGAELADAGGGKVGLEFLEAAEVLVDLLFEPSGQFAAAAIRLHPLPEMYVVVVLAGIVEDGGVLAERAL